MSENKQVMDESREMMEELCGPSAEAVASAVEDEAAANAEVAFCDAAEELIAASPEISAAVVERAVQVGCDDFAEAHARALLREVELRHAAEGVSKLMAVARDQALELADKANADLLVAIVERDMRVKDEALRAQRVDVEALRAKVELMKKNLIAVDARADERFASALHEKDAACEQRVKDLLEAERRSNIALVEKSAQDVADLAAVRAGEAVRVEAINTAMETIWAASRRDRGAPRNDRELVVALTQVLSAARLHAQ